ncbi:MAG: hypothetical protein ACK4IK_01095 [Bacteroidia bacterium]
MKKLIIALLLLIITSHLIANNTGNESKDLGISKGEILIVVIDQNGEENYTKVKLTEPGVAELVVENNDPISAKFPVYLFEDKLQRLSAGFYLVMAASDDALRNRLVYIR